ncbi:hypothetical protein BSKO_11938 [Bryopsis sp. KO-2023]|nr:hypothetical protein BSKO_11938 [Bryopsis sp. KO-2023]
MTSATRRSHFSGSVADVTSVTLVTSATPASPTFSSCERRFVGDAVSATASATSLKPSATPLKPSAMPSPTPSPTQRRRRNVVRKTKTSVKVRRRRVGDGVGGTPLPPCRKSILLLGPPGAGKTTVLWDMARVLSEKMGRKVVIVDTSNEIGGYGNIPHPFIGSARRIQVPNIAEQYKVMVEAVQNHRPERHYIEITTVVMVDEVGRREVAEACRCVGGKGVQLIATVHGHTLKNLVKNPELEALVGGIQNITIFYCGL